MASTKKWELGENLNEARLAQSVEHGTLNPRVVGSSPTSGAFPLMFQFVVLYRIFIYQPTASSVQDKLNDMHTTNNNIDYLSNLPVIFNFTVYLICNLFIIIIIIIRISDD
ncbi:hypothetical protein T12_8068 [Trichinella patagoniensis]|uniref:Uncharacterized protein n=1 Tax=Trichinella patagoniensis TaxID=990121 RepID=A0A0V1AC79_9BILA|nr:hypothetical protein T12_8068 [Trichinella patagoniensis]